MCRPPIGKCACLNACLAVPVCLPARPSERSPDRLFNSPILRMLSAALELRSAKDKGRQRKQQLHMHFWPSEWQGVVAGQVLEGRAGGPAATARPGAQRNGGQAGVCCQKRGPTTRLIYDCGSRPPMAAPFHQQALRQAAFHHPSSIRVRTYIHKLSESCSRSLLWSPAAGSGGTGSECGRQHSRGSLTVAGSFGSKQSCVFTLAYYRHALLYAMRHSWYRPGLACPAPALCQGGACT